MLTRGRRSMITTEPERDDIAYMDATSVPNCKPAGDSADIKFKEPVSKCRTRGERFPRLYIIRFLVPERRLSSHSQLITLCWPYTVSTVRSRIGDGDL